jgi:glycosyltransferase involved in cell wall biosynthesis
VTETVARRKRIGVLTPCFNEVDNVRPLYEQIRAVFAGLPQYEYEHYFIDNASTDGTQEVLRALAAEDPRVKVIFNQRNFGHIRSPYYGLLAADGDAVIALASDLQDPPSLIPAFLERWEAGSPVVLGVKQTSRESPLFFAVRGLYYRLIGQLSDVHLIQHATGFGLYDRSFLEVVRKLDDPYPYFRGLVSELGFPATTIPYEQPARTRGLTKNNFFTLYDLAMLGITSHSKLPLRFATLGGFLLSALSLLVGLGYLVYKLVFWDRFAAGVAPLVIGVFFTLSVVLFFLGVLGEYVIVIHTHVLRRPPVVERERLNFAPPGGESGTGR